LADFPPQLKKVVDEYAINQGNKKKIYSHYILCVKATLFCKNTTYCYLFARVIHKALIILRLKARSGVFIDLPREGLKQHTTIKVIDRWAATGPCSEVVEVRFGQDKKGRSWKFRRRQYLPSLKGVFRPELAVPQNHKRLPKEPLLQCLSGFPTSGYPDHVQQAGTEMPHCGRN
jgi:hypothetical protein